MLNYCHRSSDTPWTTRTGAVLNGNSFRHTIYRHQNAVKPTGHVIITLETGWAAFQTGSTGHCPKSTMRGVPWESGKRLLTSYQMNMSGHPAWGLDSVYMSEWRLHMRARKQKANAGQVCNRIFTATVLCRIMKCVSFRPNINYVIFTENVTQFVDVPVKSSARQGSESCRLWRNSLLSFLTGWLLYVHSASFSSVTSRKFKRAFNRLYIHVCCFSMFGNASLNLLSVLSDVTPPPGKSLSN